MRILFTKNNTLLSRLIRHVTGEDVSHCVLEVHGWLVHSNLYGVHAELPQDFKSDVVYSVEVPYNPEGVIRALAAYQGRMYDFGALLYLGLRVLCPWLPKKNLWRSSGMFLCTEWITAVLNGKEDSMITPYQLYERLKQ